MSPYTVPVPLNFLLSSRASYVRIAAAGEVAKDLRR